MRAAFRARYDRICAAIVDPSGVTSDDCEEEGEQECDERVVGGVVYRARPAQSHVPLRNR